MRKMLFTLIISSIILNFACFVYADDEIDEGEISEEEFYNILETAIDTVNVPQINSRNAIVYDRTSRRSFIWKVRKYEM